MQDVSAPAEHVGHDVVAVPAERGQVVHALAAKPLIGAVMHLKLDVILGCVADTAPGCSRFKLCEPRRILAPPATVDVCVVIHDSLSVP